MHLPEGFSAVTPYLFVDGAGDYIAFLKHAFSGREIGRTTAPEGRIANCQIQLSGATIMVSEASDAFPRAEPRSISTSKMPMPR
ncbi:hypothetical protein U5922_011050 [Aquicoccus sp. G2-2]|uniref:hypothetical protein n=1 Tax=Aquicoccus sp. G2-2 TaxID=3092120 RepID=UPI002ADF1235|nr:hypothetical protein [Aquicoccus sp. G2-2]MEA1113975.1 hypothetical protein [Aquicoccus sp. G2-2]